MLIYIKIRLIYLNIYYSQWCVRGSCVTKGRHPGMVNGEWSSWSVWTSCSRTCGAGVQHAYRLCNNPSPALGGRYCVGSRARHQTCNAEVVSTLKIYSYLEFLSISLKLQEYEKKKVF